MFGVYKVYRGFRGFSVFVGGYCNIFVGELQGLKFRGFGLSDSGVRGAVPRPFEASVYPSCKVRLVDAVTHAGAASSCRWQVTLNPSA